MKSSHKLNCGIQDGEVVVRPFFEVEGNHRVTLPEGKLIENLNKWEFLSGIGIGAFREAVANIGGNIVFYGEIQLEDGEWSELCDAVVGLQVEVDPDDRWNDSSGEWIDPVVGVSLDPQDLIERLKLKAEELISADKRDVTNWTRLMAHVDGGKRDLQQVSGHGGVRSKMRRAQKSAALSGRDHLQLFSVDGEPVTGVELPTLDFDRLGALPDFYDENIVPIEAEHLIDSLHEPLSDYIGVRDASVSSVDEFDEIEDDDSWRLGGHWFSISNRFLWSEDVSRAVKDECKPLKLEQREMYRDMAQLLLRARVGKPQGVHLFKGDYAIGKTFFVNRLIDRVQAAYPDSRIVYAKGWKSLWGVCRQLPFSLANRKAVVVIDDVDLAQHSLEPVSSSVSEDIESHLAIRFDCSQDARNTKGWDILRSKRELSRELDINEWLRQKIVEIFDKYGENITVILIGNDGFGKHTPKCVQVHEIPGEDGMYEDL